MSTNVARQQDIKSGRRHSRLPALVAIWSSSVLTAVASPDMVTGSEHEHLPMAALTVWLWAAVASTFVLMTPTESDLTQWSVAVVVVWVGVLLVAMLAPSMVTGSDPTEIPLGALLAPIAGAFITGLLCMRQATGGL